MKLMKRIQTIVHAVTSWINVSSTQSSSSSSTTYNHLPSDEFGNDTDEIAMHSNDDDDDSAASPFTSYQHRDTRQRHYKVRIVLLVLLLVFVTALIIGQLFLFFSGHVCASSDMIYADRSIDNRYFTVGAHHQGELFPLAVRGLAHTSDLLARAQVKHWWLDSGMLLAYYRNPNRAWITWDTDADVAIDIRDLPQLMTIEDVWVALLREEEDELDALAEDARVATEHGLDTVDIALKRAQVDTGRREWTLLSARYSQQQYGTWSHSPHAPFHLIHKRSGFRLEYWIALPLSGSEYAQSKFHAPRRIALASASGNGATQDDACDSMWSSNVRGDVGRNAELVYPRSMVHVSVAPKFAARYDRDIPPRESESEDDHVSSYASATEAASDPGAAHRRALAHARIDARLSSSASASSASYASRSLPSSPATLSVLIPIPRLDSLSTYLNSILPGSAACRPLELGCAPMARKVMCLSQTGAQEDLDLDEEPAKADAHESDESKQEREADQRIDPEHAPSSSSSAYLTFHPSSSSSSFLPSLFRMRVWARWLPAFLYDAYWTRRTQNSREEGQARRDIDDVISNQHLLARRKREAYEVQPPALDLALSLLTLSADAASTSSSSSSPSIESDAASAHAASVAASISADVKASIDRMFSEAHIDVAGVCG